MNCVNYVKKTVCMVLMLAFVLISCLGAFATSENPKKLGILASSIKITDTKVEYIEYKDDGAYFVEETISGNIITSDFYKISNGEKIHSSQIISSVSGKNVISRETDANGQVTTYSVKGIVSRDTNEKSIVPYAIRTDNYSISLVGKKVTIASAAMAITLVSNYIPTTGAEDIIKKAIVETFYDNPSLYEGYVYQGSQNYQKVEFGNCDVVIPIVKITGTNRQKDTVKVIGQFYWYGFSLSGKTLYEAQSGGGVAVMFLKKDGGRYQVKKVVHPRDGGLLQKDLVKLYGSDGKAVSDVLEDSLADEVVKTLRTYVKQNQLDIKYYKAFGWDPEKIDEQDEINESLRFVGSVIFVERVEDGLLALDLVKGIDDTEKRRALEQAAKMLFG